MKRVAIFEVDKVKMKKLYLSAVTAVLLSTVGCATTQNTLTEEGSVEHQPVVESVTEVSKSAVEFPAIDKAWYSTVGQYKGSFPNWSNVALVDYGMSKDQLWTLLDRPHYKEGLFNVKKWNYVLNYRENGQVHQCQLQIHFDKNKQVEGLYWANPECQKYAQNANKPIVNNIIQQVQKAPEGAQLKETLTLEADALFAFNKFTIGDMLPQGHHALNNAIAQIKELEGQEQVSVYVIGHTDRLGDEAYNLDLSDKRAKSVVAYMLSRGIKPVTINALGAGEYIPVKQCSEGNRKQVIQCLQPNRRVEIMIYTHR